MSTETDSACQPQSEVADVTLNPTEKVRAQMRVRYPSPEWALLEEVAPRTGGGTRYADAVAINLWSSRGHAIHGFEIKVSRSDWLRELKNPEKAEPVYRYCDHWWVVTTKDVIKPGELPTNWGHLESSGRALVQQTAAPRLHAVPLEREFFASLVRRAHEQVSAIAESQQRAAISNAHAVIAEKVKRGVEMETLVGKRLAERVARFEKETGIVIDDYRGPSKAAIALAMRIDKMHVGSYGGGLEGLERTAASLENAAKILREGIAEIQLLETTP